MKKALVLMLAVLLLGAVGMARTDIFEEVIVGKDGTGHDVIFYSDTAGAYLKWDTSKGRLYLYTVDQGGEVVSPLRVVATIDGPTGYYYGLQSNISRSGTDAIDDMTAVTASIQIGAGDFTTTGRVAPLQALIWGDGWDSKDITGEVYAAWIANRGTMTATDAVLCVHNQDSATTKSGILLDLNGAYVTNAIELSGNVAYGLDFSGGTIGTADARLSNEALIVASEVGAIVANKCTAVEYQAATQKTVLTFTLTGDHDLDLADGDHGTGIQVYGLPEGRILILGATIDAVVVTSANYEASPNDVFVVACGTVVGADDNTLTDTEADIIPSTELDTVGATELTLDWHAALAASAHFDGTGTAKDLYVNVACTDASASGANTYAITGTMTISWVNLGDY